jgi:YebC/PmpR family DNA-binding regulatory protein
LHFDFNHMSGHSKWATTKRAKAVVDAKRGAIFTKLANQIIIAAREKGGDQNTNFGLRIAVEKARAANMPKDNIERAIKRGTGELGGEAIAEYIYEGIGPAKSQFIVKALTDSKNRSAANIRHIFSKYGGAMSSVMWNFEQKGVIRIMNEDLPAQAGLKVKDADEFELELIDTGADDILQEDEGTTIYVKPENLQKVKQFLDSKNIKTETAEMEYIAKEESNLDDTAKEQVQKFIDELDGDEDVSDYYSNIANL